VEARSCTPSLTSIVRDFIRRFIPDVFIVRVPLFTRTGRVTKRAHLSYNNTVISSGRFFFFFKPSPRKDRWNERFEPTRITLFITLARLRAHTRPRILIIGVCKLKVVSYTYIHAKVRFTYRQRTDQFREYAWFLP